LPGLLSADRGLLRRRLGVDGSPLCGAFDFGFSRLGLRLLGLRVGDRFDPAGLFALLRLGLLQLPLGGQRIVSGNGADDFLRLALHRVDQPLTCLVGLAGFSHPSPLVRQ
jgi:hypothetical protein